MSSCFKRAKAGARFKVTSRDSYEYSDGINRLTVFVEHEGREHGIAILKDSMPNGPPLTQINHPLGSIAEFMKRTISVIGILLVLQALAGCLSHPQARTTFLVAAMPGSNSQAQIERTANDIVERVAHGNKLSLIEERLDKNGHLRDKTYWEWLLGRNPDLWLTIRFEYTQVTIEIKERYISRSTAKHRALAADLKAQLEHADLAVRKVDSP